MNKPIYLSTSPLYYSFFESPIGIIGVAITSKGLKAVIIVSTHTELVFHIERVKLPIECDHSKCSLYTEQIQEYFKGTRQQFTLPLDWDDISSFQEKVLRATLSIPYAETRTYREIAEQIGNPLAARAVGHVEATNPIPIVIPCHRVIGVDGLLRGYSGGSGITTKQWLLDHEQRHKIQNNNVIINPP